MTPQEIFRILSKYHPRCFLCKNPVNTVHVKQRDAFDNKITVTYKCGCLDSQQNITGKGAQTILPSSFRDERFIPENEIPYAFIPGWRITEALNEQRMIDCPVCQKPFELLQFMQSERDYDMPKSVTHFYQIDCHRTSGVKHVTWSPDWTFRQIAKVFVQSLCSPYRETNQSRSQEAARAHVELLRRSIEGSELLSVADAQKLYNDVLNSAPELLSQETPNPNDNLTAEVLDRIRISARIRDRARRREIIASTPSDFIDSYLQTQRNSEIVILPPNGIQVPAYSILQNIYPLTMAEGENESKAEEKEPDLDSQKTGKKRKVKFF